MYELRRLLLDPKRWVLLLMIAAVNLALFSGFCRTEREKEVARWEQARLWGQDIRGENAQKTKAYLSTEYYNYLEYVQNQSKTQSVLGKLSKTKKADFLTRSLEKTAQAYAGLEGITLRGGENRGILAVIGYDTTDYLLLLAPLLLVLELLADADTAVGALTRTTRHGRVSLCFWRILAIGILSLISAGILYGGNVLYTFIFYGNCGLTRPVQSLPEFQLCPYRITVGGFFCAAWLLKALAATTIALFIWVVLSRFHAAVGWGISGAVLAGLWLLRVFVLPTARLNHFRFLNVFTVLESDIFFRQYANLNWFGYPSNFFTDALVLSLGVLGILAVLCLFFIGRCYPHKAGQGLAAVQDRFARLAARHLPCHTLFGFEGWKLLFAQKAAFVLIAVGVFGFTLWRDTQLYMPVSRDTDFFYQYYGGEITDKNIARIAKFIEGDIESLYLTKNYLRRVVYEEHTNKDIENALGRIASYRADIARYEQFLGVMLDLRSYGDKTGQRLWFVRQGGYDLLIHENAAQRRCSMVLLLFLVFAFHGICAYDNRYETGLLLRSTKNGRAKMRFSQTLWVGVLTAIAATGLHLVYVLHIARDVGFDALDAPAQSMQVFRWIPFAVSFRTVIIAYMAVRFLAAFALAEGVVLVSRFSRTPQKALLVALVVFLLPSALAESGVSQLGYFDFVHWLGLQIR